MPKVIIYTTPTCPYCHLAKEFFQEHNVAFEEFNVAEDEQAREEMIKKSKNLAVPVIDVDGEIIIGFDKAKLEKLLLKK
ncbi:TPA: NrdH-redoxin [Candidatus Azambacteria bacterium]|uniref:Glutaredoxin-like protein, YruB-family n=4 Tax=Candidatus Azamiibacteriota TaxID=1752741 RepID=A0A0G1NKA0_9BACT|nr:MAG: Glutaredoxin-like protein, YruB-family [Candidatus Azambacteria bacterium GW2011_GWC1_46_13]KKU34529.1 MAG: Glutaredoxin-like protein, YruB-family [Candidatus Azambacteria bacterium GW2011_GWB1_46_27]KKU37304.1 MAG: Glutaredoxin-like protein, YruB-family [Candidatus Azambacteria bacterium GW2011_GWF2_46_32]HAM96126.1 NrdH-redoxin [Candidatus Azambacteria bacterium]HAQ05492.1 NrdH-redoxin [Candidatus Azambacteria bacterium]